jgi:hypothetical protein
MDDYIRIETEVIRITEVTTTGVPVEDAYWGVAAYAHDPCLVRAARSLGELAALVGDLTDPLALFALAQREYPLGHLDGSAMSNAQLDAWLAARQPLPDPKPFTPRPGFPTQTELLRIETVDVGTERVTDEAFGIAARGPFGEAIARIASTLEDLAGIVELGDHADRWDYVASCATIGTVTGGYVDPLTRALSGFRI